MIAGLAKKPWLRWVGYPAFFQLAFVGGIYLTFPYEQLRDRVVSEARRAMDMQVSVEKVRLAGVTGLTLHGVDLGETAAPATRAGEDGEAEAPAVPTRLHLDKVTAKADLLALVRGKQAVRFDVDAFGGELDGRMEIGEEERAFTARIRGIDFSRTPLQAVAGLDLAGRIEELVIDLRSPGADFSKANGVVEVRGDQLVLNGGTVQMFELPRVELGSLNGRIEVKEGVADFQEFAVRGSDLEAQVEGNVRLQPMLKSSSINGRLKLKPSEDWWNRNEMLKTAANFALPAGGDGYRTLGIYGALSQPNFRPQK